MLEFIRRAVAYLVERRNLPLTALVRWKFVLAKVLAQKISQHRERAANDRYQQNLFGPQAAVETNFVFQFVFVPTGYALHYIYAGHPYEFQKHYYPFVGELKSKGEEYECAKALDMNGRVKHWVRNLDRRGFWLPLAQRKFYPDFVAELDDGRILVVEHKGEVYATNDDSKEKCNVGALWEEKSHGKALFLMTVLEKGKRRPWLSRLPQRLKPPADDSRVRVICEAKRGIPTIYRSPLFCAQLRCARAYGSAEEALSRLRAGLRRAEEALSQSAKSQQY